MEQKPYQGWSILVDADGCLTDGKKYVDATGQRQMIAFHSRDSIACKALVEMGFQVIVLTHSNYHGIGHYWMKYGAYIHVSEGGDPMTNKLDVENWESVKIDWEKTIGIGDDVTDICYLEKCKKAYCPLDAHSILLNCAIPAIARGQRRLPKDFKSVNIDSLKVNGGEGILSELLFQIQIGKVIQHAEH